MPGSQYAHLSTAFANILEKVLEANIRTDKTDVLRTFQTSKLEDDEVVVNLDLECLFTKVPSCESIEYTVDQLYSTQHAPAGVNNSTFKVLLEMVPKDVIMPSHGAYFKQNDDVAMGNSAGPLLANISVSKYDSEFGSFSKFYHRYLDDVIKTLRIGGDSYLLGFVDTLYESLTFTLEKPEDQCCIVLLEMEIQRHVDRRLSSLLYRKKSDTGVLLRFHASSPDLHKRSMAAGMLHRINMTNSNWKIFNNSIIEIHNNLRNKRITTSTMNKISLAPKKIVRVTGL